MSLILPSSEILLNFFPKFAFSHTAAVTATARHLNALARFPPLFFALLCFNFRLLLCFSNFVLIFLHWFVFCALLLCIVFLFLRFTAYLCFALLFAAFCFAFRFVFCSAFCFAFRNCCFALLFLPTLLCAWPLCCYGDFPQQCICMFTPSRAGSGP